MEKIKTPVSDCQSKTQGFNNESKEIIIHEKTVTGINVGECILIGPERHLIPDGFYEAIFSHHETASVFTKKVGDVREGGKLYLWFDIDPLHNSNVLNPNEKIKLYISYNAASVGVPTGRNGKFKMTRGKKFVQDFERLIGTVKRRDRISPSNYRNKVFKVKVRTVTIDKNKREYTEGGCYSIIDELVEILVG